MLVKDSAAGAIQVLESFTSKYASDNQAYASPPTSTEWPRLRTLTGADIPDIVAAINGYGLAPGTSGALSTRFMSITQTGVVTQTASTATTPLSQTFTTSAVATNSSGFQENFAGSRTLGILKSVKYSLRLRQTANMRIWMGLSLPGTSFSTDTPAAALVGFRYSTAAGDTKYQCVTQTAAGTSTKNAESTSTHVDTNAHIFEIQYDGTNAVFLIDGVQVGSQAGTIPANTVALAHIIFIDNVGLANARGFDLFNVTGADYPTG